MNTDRFDSLVTQLASPQTRRTVCGGLLRGLLAIAPVLATWQLADAKKRRNVNKRRNAKKRRNVKERRCEELCSRLRCRYRCSCGNCVCPQDWRRCGELCYPRCGKNMQRDPETCECR